MPNFADNPIERADHSRLQRSWRAVGSALTPVRGRLRWDELSVRRRTTVSWMANATLGGLACTVIFLAQGRFADARPFAGVTVVLAVVTAALHAALLRLRRRHHGVLYGVSAVGGSAAFATVAITARTSSDVVSAIALVPPLVGSWFAVHWVARLSARGLAGADFADATTTIRGTAAVWCVVVVLTVVGAPFAAGGHGMPIAAALSGGLSGFFSVAVIFTYAGPGWTEYQRGLAASSPVSRWTTAETETAPE